MKNKIKLISSFVLPVLATSTCLTSVASCHVFKRDMIDVMYYEESFEPLQQVLYLSVEKANESYATQNQNEKTKSLTEIFSTDFYYFLNTQCNTLVEENFTITKFLCSIYDVSANRVKYWDADKYFYSYNFSLALDCSYSRVDSCQNVKKANIKAKLKFTDFCFQFKKVENEVDQYPFICDFASKEMNDELEWSVDCWERCEFWENDLYNTISVNSIFNDATQFDDEYGLHPFKIFKILNKVDVDPKDKSKGTKYVFYMTSRYFSKMKIGGFGD